MVGRKWCRRVVKVNIGRAGIVIVFMSIEWEIGIKKESVLY